MIRQIKAIAPRVGIWAGRARKPIFFLYLVMGTQLSLSPCQLRFFLVYNIGMASTLCLFPPEYTIATGDSLNLSVSQWFVYSKTF